jgi:hypothetical protein
MRATSLTHKHGKLSRSSGQWSDNDFDVLADGKVVGRIYEDAHLNADLPSPPKSRALGRCGQ